MKVNLHLRLLKIVSTTGAVVYLAMAALSVPIQANPTPGSGQDKITDIMSIPASVAQLCYERTRANCILSRKMILGKIIKILPEGLVIECGYTNLMDMPNTRSWLIKGTGVAFRPKIQLDADRSDGICVGLIFLSDVPKSRGITKKPMLYDYVTVEGFPMGHYTYVSVGSVQRTVERFTSNLGLATQWQFNHHD